MDGKVFDSAEDAQAQLDGWVCEYNFERGHQSLGMAVPWDRFHLAAKIADPVEVVVDAIAESETLAGGATRKVGATGHVSFAGASYHAARWLAGEEVVVVCDNRLVHLHHRGVLIATHARASPERQGARRAASRSASRARPEATVGDRAISDAQGRLER